MSIQFGTAHLMSTETAKKVTKDMAPLNGRVIGITWIEAMAVAVGDETFNAAQHWKYDIKSGPYQGMTCLMDGAEERRLQERCGDIFGKSLNELSMTEAELQQRFDQESSTLINEAREAGTLNKVEAETAFYRVGTYLAGIMAQARERLSIVWTPRPFD